MHVLVVMNQKGGVGKTTTAISIAYEFSQMGLRVLLIDNDAQASATEFLGFDPESVTGGGLPEFFMERRAGDVADYVQPAREGLDLMGSNSDLNAANAAAMARTSEDSRMRLHNQAHVLADRYDVVIVDCSPGITYTTAAALHLLDAAAVAEGSGIVAPLLMEVSSAAGVAQLCDTVDNVNNGSLQIAAFVPCRFDGRTTMARQVLDELRASFPGRVTTPVRQTVRVAESPNAGEVIQEYDPGSTAAEDYRTVAREIAHMTGISLEPSSESSPKPPTTAVR